MEGTASQDPRSPLTQERTLFAKYRTQLALDRTTLAWLRTALTFATFGFGMVGFFRAVQQTANTPESAKLHQAAIHMGVALILIGVIGLLSAAAAHLLTLGKLRRGETLPSSTWPLTLPFPCLSQFLVSTACGPSSTGESQKQSANTQHCHHGRLPRGYSVASAPVLCLLSNSFSSSAFRFCGASSMVSFSRVPVNWNGI